MTPFDRPPDRYKLDYWKVVAACWRNHDRVLEVEGRESGQCTLFCTDYNSGHGYTIPFTPEIASAIWNTWLYAEQPER